MTFTFPCSLQDVGSKSYGVSGETTECNEQDSVKTCDAESWGSVNVLKLVIVSVETAMR